MPVTAGGAARPATPVDLPPEPLRPFLFHGVDLDWRKGKQQASGTCPFCGRDGKFSVEVSTGLWRCLVCAVGPRDGGVLGGGNSLGFLRLWWDHCDRQTTPAAATSLAQDRGLLDPSTVDQWGICQSLLTGDWLVPGWDAQGRLCQLYRWVKQRATGKRLLLATPNHHHGLHGVDHYDPNKPNIDLCEGWGDGLALWEILGRAKWLEGRLEFTGNVAGALLSQTSVLAAPGCTTFKDDWLALFAGKNVTLWYDSDHPKEHNGVTTQAGLDGMKRVAQVLARATNPPSSIHWHRWGQQGYDESKKPGHDVRDELAPGKTVHARLRILRTMLERIDKVPPEWVEVDRRPRSASGEIEPKPCNKWSVLEDCWKLALRWRQDLSDAFSVMLAVAASTSQSGDQLFLQVIGEPSSGKTRLCDAMLVSKRCKAIEHLTGFFSGSKGEDGKDLSLVSRINHLTLITPEADTLVSSPLFAQLMGQQRRLFDGKAGAIYKNTDEDKEYKNLRAPWIQAGTPSMLAVVDQSRVGDRFLKVYIDHPDHLEKRAILDHVAASAFDAVVQTSNCDGASTLEGKVLKAYQLTGGYIDWMRDQVGTLLPKIYEATDRRAVGLQCSDLAEFTADMRARPEMDMRKVEAHDGKEQPGRLTHQYVRLATLLTLVLNRPAIDGEVLRRLTKVAMDTSRGRTLQMVRWMVATNPSTGVPNQEHGLGLGVLHQWTGMGEERLMTYLTFLQKVGVLAHQRGYGTLGTWRLTDRVHQLYQSITGA